MHFDEWEFRRLLFIERYIRWQGVPSTICHGLAGDGRDIFLQQEEDRAVPPGCPHHFSNVLIKRSKLSSPAFSSPSL